MTIHSFSEMPVRHFYPYGTAVLLIKEKSMKKIALSIFLLFSVQVLFAQSQKVGSKDLKALFTIMSGTFSSEKQSIEDADFFHISLIMKPIWSEKKDGHWLYVEQAMATTLDTPYRQRVYHIYQYDDYTLVSKVYEIENQEEFAGKSHHPEALDKLTQEHLIDKEGCGIYLKKATKNRFEGSTKDKDCPSNLRGASYTTSSVILNKNGMTSWDQGWDAEGNQVWGAVKGGYRFDKVK